MNTSRYAMFSLLLILTGITFTLVSAQDTDTDCDITFETVMNQVSQICTEIDENQVCYGNSQVNATFNDDLPAQPPIFEQPGDLASVINLNALYLSALDTRNQLWGIAQMRLLANLDTGTEDVMLVLFGDVSIESAVEDRVTVAVTNENTFDVAFRYTPVIGAYVAERIAPGETVEAIGKLRDSDWLHVRLPDSQTGWVEASLMTASGALDDLMVEDSETPYFGPMQAFYFRSGDSGCGNSLSDGLLIQTPEGTARVTLLINEVSIDLYGSETGATALIQSNPDQGMAVSMLAGSSTVTSDGTTLWMDPNTSTTIPMDANNLPVGAPSYPQPVDTQSVSNLTLIQQTANNAQQGLPTPPPLPVIFPSPFPTPLPTDVPEVVDTGNTSGSNSNTTTSSGTTGTTGTTNTGTTNTSTSGTTTTTGSSTSNDVNADNSGSAPDDNDNDDDDDNDNGNNNNSPGNSGNTPAATNAAPGSAVRGNDD